MWCTINFYSRIASRIQTELVDFYSVKTILLNCMQNKIFNSTTSIVIHLKKLSIIMFIKYLSIGIVNTAIHWAIFAICFLILNLNQGISNLIAFILAVTFSFFMNSYFTFNKRPTSIRYVFLQHSWEY